MRKNFLSAILSVILTAAMIMQVCASPLAGYVNSSATESTNSGEKSDAGLSSGKVCDDVSKSDEYIQPDPTENEEYLEVFGQTDAYLMSDLIEIEAFFQLEEGKNYVVTNTLQQDITLTPQSTDAPFDTAVYDEQNQLVSFARKTTAPITLSPSCTAHITPSASIVMTYSSSEEILVEECEEPALKGSCLETGKNYKISNSADSDINITPENAKLYYEFLSYDSTDSLITGSNKQKGALTALAGGYIIITPLVNNSENITVYYPSVIAVEETEQTAYAYHTLTVGKNYKITNTTGINFTVRKVSGGEFDGVLYSGSSQSIYKSSNKDISVKDGQYLTITPASEDLTISFVNDKDAYFEEVTDAVFTYITMEPGKNYKITNNTSLQKKVYKSDSTTELDIASYKPSSIYSVYHKTTSSSYIIPANGNMYVSLAEDNICQLYFPNNGDMSFEETETAPIIVQTLSYGTNYKISNSGSANMDIYKTTSSKTIDAVLYKSGNIPYNTYYERPGSSLEVYTGGYTTLTPHQSDTEIYYANNGKLSFEECETAPLEIHTLSVGKSYKITNNTSSEQKIYKTNSNLGENSVVYKNDNSVYKTYLKRYSSYTEVIANGYLIISPVESNESDMTVYYPNNGTFSFEEVETSPLKFTALDAGKSYKISNNSSAEVSVKVINTNAVADMVLYDSEGIATSISSGKTFSTISIDANSYAIVAPSSKNEASMDICYANDGSITVEETEIIPVTYQYLEPGKTYKITNATSEPRTMRFTNLSSKEYMQYDAVVYKTPNQYYTGNVNTVSSTELAAGRYAIITVDSRALSALEMYYITSDVRIEEYDTPAFSKTTLEKGGYTVVTNNSSYDRSLTVTGDYSSGYTVTEIDSSGNVVYEEYGRTAKGYTVKSGNRALIFTPNIENTIEVCAPATELTLPADGEELLNSVTIAPGQTYMLAYPGDVYLYASDSNAKYDFIDFDSVNKVKRTLGGIYKSIQIKNNSSYITALRSNTSNLTFYYLADIGVLNFEEAESLTELNKENVLCSWQGEYLGSYTSWGETVNVLRNKIIKITECSDDGEIKGIAYIDKHPAADDYVTLAYNFSGRINFVTGQITYQGYGEPIYNLTNANFNYLLFSGYVDMSNSLISGCANNEEYRILSLNRVTKNNDAINVEGISVTMINDEKEYDVLSETVEFDEGSSAVPSFQVDIDPNEGITPGYIALRQNNKDIFHSVGGAFPYVQMSEFVADEPIYAYVEDEYGRECANLKLTINIIKPVVESTVHRVSGKMSMGGAVLTIFYPDEETGEYLPAKNLDFYFDSKLVTTDEDGFIDLVGIANNTMYHSILIEKDGCLRYMDDQYRFGVSKVIYLKPISMLDILYPGVVMKVLYTDSKTGNETSKDVLKDFLGFEAVSTGAEGTYCEVYVDGINADEYYIYQNGRDLYKSTDGHFEQVSFNGTSRSYKGPNIVDPNLFNNKWEYIFQTEKSVYLRVVINGESYLHSTNLKIIDGTGSIYFVVPDNHFTEFTFGGKNLFSKKINYNGDNDILDALLDGTSISFLENTLTFPFAVTYAYNNHGNSKLKIVLDREASKLAKEAADGLPGPTTSLFNAGEDILDLIDNVQKYVSNTTAKKNKSYIAHTVQSKFWKDIEFSWNVSGYGETTIDLPIEDYLKSNVAFIDTKLQIDFRPKLELKLFDGQFFVGGVVPVIVTIGTTLEGRIAPFLYWPGGLSEIPSLSKTKIDLGAKLSLTPKVGLGLKDVASVYVKGNLGVDSMWRVPNGYAKIMAFGNVLFGVELMSFFKAETASVLEGYLPLVNTYPSDLDDEDIVNLASISAIPKTEEVGMTSRDYIKSTSKWNGASSASLMSTDSYSDKLTLQKSVNGSAEPIETSCGSDDILLFLMDDSTRTDANRTVLAYSVYDKATDSWSEPKAIYDNDTADFYPSVAKDGDDLYVVWNDSDQLFDDDVTLEEASAAQGISFAKYNTETKEFEYLNTVNDDSLGLFGPEATVDDGILTVVAAANSTNSIVGTADENYIKTFTYDSGFTSDVETWAESDKNIHSYSIGKINGQTVLATAIDTDGDYSTINDMEIFYTYEGSNDLKQLTQDEVVDVSPYIENNTIYYYHDGNVVSGAPNLPEITVIEDINSYEFEIIKNDNNDSAIVYTENDATGTIVKASFFNTASNEWTKPSVVYDNKEYIKSAGFYLNESGNIESLYTSLNTSTNNYDMHIVETKKTPDIVCEDVIFDESELNEDGTMDVTLTVSNRGSVAVDTVNIEISNSSQCLYSADTECALATGESKEITVQIPLDTVSKRESFKATVYADGDTNTDNNTKNITLGAVNLSLTNESVSYIGKSIITTARVSNTSNHDTTARLYVYENDRTGNPIYSENIGVIEANSSYDYVLNCEKLVDTGKSSTLYIEVKTADEEYLYSDNYDTVFFTARKPVPELYITEATKESATVSLANVSENTLNAKLIVSCYDKNGKMTKIDTVDITDMSRNAYETYTFDISTTDAYEVKAMLWDSLSGLKPIVQSTSAYITEPPAATLQITNADNSNASVNVTNISENIIDAKVILCCYDDNGKLTKADLADVTQLAQNEVKAYSFDISSADKTNVKAMLWNSLENLKPIAKPAYAFITTETEN